jgi:hypothetical protein
MAPFQAVWEVHCGVGSFKRVAGQIARYIRPLLDYPENLPEIVARHLANYLARTEFRYVSVAKFAETWGCWNSKLSPEGEKLADETLRMFGVTVEADA